MHAAPQRFSPLWKHLLLNFKFLFISNFMYALREIHYAWSTKTGALPPSWISLASSFAGPLLRILTRTHRNFVPWSVTQKMLLRWGWPSPRSLLFFTVVIHKDNSLLGEAADRSRKARWSSKSENGWARSNISFRRTLREVPRWSFSERGQGVVGNPPWCLPA